MSVNTETQSVQGKTTVLKDKDGNIIHSDSWNERITA